MYRNDDPTASPTLPTPGAPGTPGYYAEGTIVTPDAINAIQEEICNAITSLGLTLNKAQTNQLAQALALLAPLANPDFTGLVGIGTASPVKLLHIAGGGSAEMLMECTTGQVNFRSWNFLVAGAGGAKQGFSIRFMSDDGLTSHFTALSIDPASGLVTMLAPTPAPLDNSNSPVNSAYLTAAAAMIDYPPGTTLQLTDQRRPLRFSTSGAGTWTIPSYGAVPFADGVGMEILVGSASVLTLAEGSNTLTWLPSGVNGSRTITGPARVTLTHYTTNEWYIDGTGIS
jgi:hypothetical protein